MINTPLKSEATASSAAVLETNSNSLYPLLLDFPHSGAEYPPEFGYSIDFQTLRRCEDSFVDELFAAASPKGVCCVTATFPRSFIDVNRSLNELGPSVPGPAAAETEPLNMAAQSKAAQGIGLVWSHVNTNPAWPIYSRAVTAEEVADRVARYYAPYRKTFERNLDRLRRHNKLVYRIACHSMPSYAQNASHGVPSDPVLADFNLGFKGGKTASREFVDVISSHLASRGFSVWIDEPYKGHGMVEDYGCPADGLHSVLLEVNRALYMREDTVEKRPWFAQVQDEMTLLVDHVLKYALDSNRAEG